MRSTRWQRVRRDGLTDWHRFPTVLLLHSLGVFAVLTRCCFVAVLVAATPAVSDATAVERVNASLGIVRMSMRMDTLAAAAVRLLTLDEVFMAFTEVNVSAAQNKSAFVITPSGLVLNSTAVLDDLDVAMATVHTYTVCGQQWQASFYATHSFVDKRRSFAPYTIVIVLVVVTIVAIVGPWCSHVVVNSLLEHCIPFSTPYAGLWIQATWRW